jgi:hypothetical protein
MGHMACANTASLRENWVMWIGIELTARHPEGRCSSLSNIFSPFFSGFYKKPLSFQIQKD